MGGDHAPDEIVRGVAAASRSTPTSTVCWSATKARIQAILEQGPYNPERIAVLHARDSDRDGRGRARGRARRARTRRCWSRCAPWPSGRADAIVSAGNTGACVLAAREALRAAARHPARGARVRPPAHDRVPGPGPAGAAARRRARRCAARPTSCVQFALMGSAYARRISKVPNPRVGLLNMGREDGKGGETLVEAHRRLRAQPMIDFVGNVEGNDLVRGRADVIVCEGYVGNVALKLLEGVSEVLVDVAQAAAERKLVWRVGLRLLSQGIERVHALTDFSRYGGSPILGFDQLFIKCHGRSRARAVGERGEGRGQGGARPRAGRDRGRDRRYALTLLRRRSRRAGRRAAAALSLGSRQDLSAQRVRHPAPAVADRARARRGQGRGARRRRGAEGTARRRRPARPSRRHATSSPPARRRSGRPSATSCALDGVPYDGIVFKDQLQLLRRGKFGNLREHVGFKLGELFRGRAGATRPPASCSSATTGNRTRSPTRSTPTCWPVRCRSRRSGRCSCASGSTPRWCPEVCALAAPWRGSGGVERIFINLERRTPPASFRALRPAPRPDLQLLPDGARARGRRLARSERRGRRSPAGWLDRAGYTRAPPRELAGRPGPPRPRCPRTLAHRLTTPVRAGRTAAGAPARRLGGAPAGASRATAGARRPVAGQPEGALDYDDILARASARRAAATRDEAQRAMSAAADIRRRARHRRERGRGERDRPRAGRGAARGLRQRGRSDPVDLSLAGRRRGSGGASADDQGARGGPARARGARARAPLVRRARGRWRCRWPPGRRTISRWLDGATVRAR